MKTYLPGSELLEDDDLPAGMVLRPLVQSLHNKIPSRQPRLAVVVQPAQEFLTRQLRSLPEPRLNTPSMGQVVSIAHNRITFEDPAIRGRKENHGSEVVKDAHLPRQNQQTHSKPGSAS